MKQTEKSREELIEEILEKFVLLGICEPRTEREQQAVEERRQKMGAEKFDKFACKAHYDVMAFIEELETNERS